MRQLLRYPVTYFSSLNILDNKAFILESNTLAAWQKVQHCHIRHWGMPKRHSQAWMLQLGPGAHKMSVISRVDTDGTIQPQTIRDYFHLGKFKNSNQKQQCRPKPLIVKFIRSANVSSILSKRWSLQQPFSINLTSAIECSHDSNLMKERWSLIQSGTDCKYIKIQNSRIYIHNELHGQINGTTGEF